MKPAVDLATSRRFLSALALAYALAWIWLSRVPDTNANQSRIPSPRADFPAPDFSLETLDGEQVTLSGLRGRAVIVNLWASWCVPCRAEMPALQRVYDAYRDQGLVVLAVNSTNQDSIHDAGAFANEFGLTFPIPLDLDGTVGRRYLMRALPTTFFIDREGVIRAVIVGGPMSESTLKANAISVMSDR